MVPEIWSVTDRIFGHSGLLFTLLDPENQNFEKMKNTTEDIIILQMSTINDSHMMYGSWDMEYNGQRFWKFWTVFCPFNPATTPKIKILKNEKKHIEILSFYTGVP